jgi:hypothetical protein
MTEEVQDIGRFWACPADSSLRYSGYCARDLHLQFASLVPWICPSEQFIALFQVILLLVSIPGILLRQRSLVRTDMGPV